MMICKICHPNGYRTSYGLTVLPNGYCAEHSTGRSCYLYPIPKVTNSYEWVNMWLGKHPKKMVETDTYVDENGCYHWRGNFDYGKMME